MTEHTTRDHVEACVRIEITGILALSARSPGVIRTDWVNEAVDNVLAKVDAYVATEVPVIQERRRELLAADAAFSNYRRGQ
jgi:hypothetical protein